MDRTIRILLQPTTEQACTLSDTVTQFTAVFNAVCRHGWETGQKNGVKLHHDTYYPLKAEYPELVSDLHVQARVKATEAIKSALTLKRKRKKVSVPYSSSCPPRYNLHTYKLDWNACTIRLSTTQGRMTIPFQVPEYAAKYVGNPVCTADLVCRGGKWWLHVVVQVKAPEQQVSDTVVGVDLGVVQPAVTSNNQFLGKKSWRNVENRYFRLRRALQLKGTKSAKRHLKKMRGKQRRFHRDCDHVLSKQIVLSCEPGSVIVLENLRDIRQRVKVRHGAQSRRIHGWSFAQIGSFIRYKAEERGCMVVGIDPRHTSQACSRCGHVARNNRRSRALFRCRKCGYETHADRNGALNIAAKYRASIGMTGAGGLPSTSLSRPDPGDASPGL